jgi:hypothetical protein
MFKVYPWYGGSVHTTVFEEVQSGADSIGPFQSKLAAELAPGLLGYGLLGYDPPTAEKPQGVTLRTGQDVGHRPERSKDHPRKPCKNDGC